MFFSFNSNDFYAVKLNGNYIGKISNGQTISTDKDGALFELCPLREGRATITSFLDKDFLLCEDKPFFSVELKGGYLIHAPEIATEKPFRLLDQARAHNFSASAFFDKDLKFSVENHDGFFADAFSIECSDAKLHPFSLNGTNLLALEIIAKKPRLAVYRLDGKIERVGFFTVDEFSFDDGFSIRERFSDIAKHEIITSFSFDNTLREKKREISYNFNLNKRKLHPRILPFAFFEELLVGGAIDDFATENITSSREKLAEFLGKFIGVFPTPEFRPSDDIGLIYKKNKTTYEVVYYHTTLKDGKIDNVVRTDD